KAHHRHLHPTSYIAVGSPINAPDQPIYQYRYRPHRNLHSFPTRRSSDLTNLGCAAGLLVATLVSYLITGKPDFSMTDNGALAGLDRKSTRLNSSHVKTSYAVSCLKKKKTRVATRPTRSEMPPPSKVRTIS